MPSVIYNPPSKVGGEEPVLHDVEAQVALGAEHYARDCARCHGAEARGANAPALVGPGSLPLRPPSGRELRNVQFRTAADLLQWTRKYMPKNDTVALQKGDYAAIVAYLLHARGRRWGGEPLDGRRAARIRLAH